MSNGAQGLGAGKDSTLGAEASLLVLSTAL